MGIKQTGALSVSGMEMERIVNIMSSMEFNERAYRRRYFIPTKEPIKSMFTRNAAEKAVKKLFELYGTQWPAICESGYKPVIKKVLEDNLCREKTVTSVFYENQPSTSKPLLPFSGKRKRSRVPQQKTRLLKHKEAAIEEQQQLEDYLQEDGNDLEDLAKAAEQHHELVSGSSPARNRESFVVAEGWCILAEGVPVNCDVKELQNLRKVVEGLGNYAYELEVLPESRSLVKEIYRSDAKPDVAVMRFTSGIICELVLDACQGNRLSVVNKAVSLRRSYSPTTVALMNLLLKQRTVRLEAPRLVFVCGFSEDWTEARLREVFEGILVDAADWKGIQHTFMVPGSSELVMQLQSEVLTDLLFYRCGGRNAGELMAVSEDLFICRGRKLIPQIDQPAAAAASYSSSDLENSSLFYDLPTIEKSVVDGTIFKF